MRVCQSVRKLSPEQKMKYFAQHEKTSYTILFEKPFENNATKEPNHIREKKHFFQKFGLLFKKQKC